MSTDSFRAPQPEIRVVRNALKTALMNVHLLSVPQVRNFVATECGNAKRVAGRLALAARDAELAGHFRAARTIFSGWLMIERLINPALEMIDGRALTRPDDPRFAAELDAVIRGLEALAEELAVSPSTPTADVPDARGYVAQPADPAAFVPAAEIVAQHTPSGDSLTYKRLVAIIENPANRVRWTKPLTKAGKPAPQRRLVHLGDWVSYLKRHAGPTAGDGWPASTAAEIERRKAAVRAARSQ